MKPFQKTAAQDSYDDLHRSYGRCLGNGPFIEQFYQTFWNSHPDVPAAFGNTDFNRQRRLLRRALSSAIMFAAGSQSVSDNIARMAEVHSRHGRAPIRPHLYEYWLDSLIGTIRKHDPELTPALETRWREAMNVVISHFVSHY